MKSQSGFKFISIEDDIRIEHTVLSYEDLILDTDDINRIHMASEGTTDKDFNLKQGGAYYISDSDTFELCDSTDDYCVPIDSKELIDSLKSFE